LGQQEAGHPLCLTFQGKEHVELANLRLAVANELGDRSAQRKLRSDGFVLARGFAGPPVNWVIGALRSHL
jgi:hypothetical protein